MTPIILAGAIAMTVLVMTRLRPRAARLIELSAPLSATPAAGASRLRRVGRIVVHRAAPIGAGALLLGPFAASIVIVVVAVWPRLRHARDLARARTRAALAYPDFVDMLVLSVKSGCTPRQALDTLLDVTPGPVRVAVTTVVQRTDTGQRFAEAVTALLESPPHGLGPIAQPLVDALALADRYGTPLPPILDRLADEARAQRRRNADAAARRLPIQLSFPLVGCTLPSFVLLTVVPLMAGTFSSLHGLPR